MQEGRGCSSRWLRGDQGEVWAVLQEKATKPNCAALRGKSKAALAEELPAFGEGFFPSLGMAELLHLHWALSSRGPTFSSSEPESLNSSPNGGASCSNRGLGFNQVFLQLLISFFFNFLCFFTLCFCLQWAFLS